ncbi:DUF2585 family protein [bacterium]|nr:DUF2585 family protein [Rubripirellula sp.]MDA7936963.1 DUF2585 family protein [bacterium]MDB4445820.1 DUF2585 family protein [bacterium]
MQRRLTDRNVAYSLVTIGLATCMILVLMERVWWCQVGDLSPWSWDIWSSHNSQHSLDPYALSHFQHGIGLFLLLQLCCSRWLSVQTCTVIVALIEAAWEILENTPFMINRYREATISLDYFGDSIVNSMSDYGVCLLGVLLVRKTNWKLGLAVFIALEVCSVLWIRDSLMLNILMLTFPVEAIKQWQAP